MKNYSNTGTSIKQAEGETSSGLAIFLNLAFMENSKWPKIFLQAISCITGVSKKGR
jgi:hypothetical protein